jgi:hypothetical protein
MFHLIKVGLWQGQLHPIAASFKTAKFGTVQTDNLPQSQACAIRKFIFGFEIEVVIFCSSQNFIGELEHNDSNLITLLC